VKFLVKIFVEVMKLSTVSKNCSLILNTVLYVSLRACSLFDPVKAIYRRKA
jgi:hypothetical protein